MMKHTPCYSGMKMGQVLRQQGRRFDWFAREMGVSASTVTRWTQGRLTLRAEHARRAARILGIPLEFLQSPKGDDSLTERKGQAA